MERNQGKNQQGQMDVLIGHIARNCHEKKGRRRAEAIGRNRSTVADITDQQLEQELANRRLTKEQSLLTNPEPSNVGTVNTVEGAVGPTLMLELFVEGLQVAAVVDTTSNSTIISRPMLHSTLMSRKAKECLHSLVFLSI